MDEIENVLEMRYGQEGIKLRNNRPRRVEQAEAGNQKGIMVNST